MMSSLSTLDTHVIVIVLLPEECGWLIFYTLLPVGTCILWLRVWAIGVPSCVGKNPQSFSRAQHSHHRRDICHLGVSWFRGEHLVTSEIWLVEWVGWKYQDVPTSASFYLRLVSRNAVSNSWRCSLFIWISWLAVKWNLLLNLIMVGSVATTCRGKACACRV